MRKTAEQDKGSRGACVSEQLEEKERENKTLQIRRMESEQALTKCEEKGM